MEQRINIKFCFKLCKMPIETYEMFQIVRGDEAINCNNESGWNALNTGVRIFQDDPRSRLPSASQNTDTVGDVREMVTRDRQWALWMMADKLNITKMIHQILHEDLQKSKICTKFGDSHHAKTVKTIPLFSF
jgi:hypothetical protein